MKKRIVIFLLLIFIASNILNSIIITNYLSLSFPKITGLGGSAAGIIMLFIEGEAYIINITSPQNTTYNFSIGSNYIIDLNASASFNAGGWWYTLRDLKHNTIASENIPFSPNTTIAAVRWSNQLIVYANDSNNNVYNNSVVFFVFVPNSNPLIGNISSKIFVCEGSYLSIPPTYFNVTDIDEDAITASIAPSDPFFVVFTNSPELNLTTFEIISGTLNKAHAGGANAGSKTYEETIYVNDGNNGTDFKIINITVIEINTAPSITNIGVQTVWSRGENSAFYKQVYVADIENGNQNSGNLTFNITIKNSSGNNVNLFNISSNGTMNFTANSSYLGIYNISVCVTDTGINNPHENISLCNQNGSALTSCNNFSLTVTDENRAPQITYYYPFSLRLNVNGTDNLYFNITKYDPDWTIPDAYWYVDESIEKSPSGIGSSSEEFTYSFGCGVSGNHTVKAEITDGLLNASIQWNLTVSYAACPPGVLPGGGVGGAALACDEKWACKEWQNCKNLEKVYNNKEIKYELMNIIKERCSLFSWNNEVCGFQVRECNDLNYCNKNLNKPGTIKECYYTIYPNCTDGIKNCHNGSCEVLVDCGGPCLACPTCSDKIQNQCEEGVDCGGPCPSCLAELPLVKRSYWWYILILLIILLAIIIIRKLIRILVLEKRYKKSKKGKEE